MRVCMIVLCVLMGVVSPCFGSDIFSYLNKDLPKVGFKEIQNMSFISSEEGAFRLDPDFTLGVGDTLFLTFWGKLEAEHKLTIDNSGSIVVPFLGKIRLLGLTFNQAHQAIKHELDQEYSNVDFDITLTDVQNILVTVLGYVKKPGVYSVTPFSKLTDVLVQAGGPVERGSVSDIQLYRGGNKVLSFNIYDFILRGVQENNVRLRHSDTIYIPHEKNLIALRGDVYYPGLYEIADKDSLKQLLSVAGGLRPSKFKRKINILRIDSDTKLIKIFSELLFNDIDDVSVEDDIMLETFDTIMVTTVFDYTPYPGELLRSVRILGEVNIPGEFIVEKNETLSNLLKRVGGMTQGAFSEGTVFTRLSLKQKQKDILGELVRAQERAILQEEADIAESLLSESARQVRQEAISSRRKALNLFASRMATGRLIVDFEAVFAGRSDVLLEAGDTIYIPSRPDWVLVQGAVYNPVAVFFEAGKPFEFYLNAVGGMTKLADSEQIHIIKANGRVDSKTTGYKAMERGDIIIVPEKIVSRR